MGRPPKPTAIKRLSGNPGKRRLNDSEPQFKRAMPRAPRFLDREARAEWKRVAHELYDVGLLTGVDRAALAAYCQAWSTWVQASRWIEENGATLTTDKGYVYPHPMVGVRDRALEQMRRFMVEFGMTPSSRSRVRVEKGEEPDELEQLLFGQRVAVAAGGDERAGDR